MAHGMCNRYTCAGKVVEFKKPLQGMLPKLVVDVWWEWAGYTAADLAIMTAGAGTSLMHGDFARKLS
eukprot:6148714-Amphidinium_carterae.1